MRRVLATIIAAVVCCGCYDSFDSPQQAGDASGANITIAELRSLWFGKRVTIVEDLSVSGRVTSSDRAGNFYRTLTICDGTGGLEVLVGQTKLFNVYPVGVTLRIALKELAIDEQNGILQAGLPAADYDYGSLDYLQSNVNIDKHITRGDGIADPDIPVLEYGSLEVSMCGCPVTIRGLVCTAADDADGAWAGYVRFEDREGNAVYTYTNAYADFAAVRVPSGRVAITGILQYAAVPYEAGKHFILKMRDDEDCRADN